MDDVPVICRGDFAPHARERQRGRGVAAVVPPRRCSADVVATVNRLARQFAARVVGGGA